MTHLEQAIRDAVEKGEYEKEIAFPRDGQEKLMLHDWSIKATLLDPAFWRALGRARGWELRMFRIDEWKENWYQLIDHLAADKDVESFFATL